MSRPIPYKSLLLGLTPLLFGFDQATKAAVRVGLPLNDAGRSERIDVIPGFFRIVHAENTGAAFSLFESASYRLPLFAVVFVLALGTIGIMIRQLKPGQWMLATSLALVLAGALGNSLDRFLYGSVTDFLDLYASGALGDWARSTFGTRHFPIFNIADICINVGVGLYLVHAVRDLFEPEEDADAPPDEPEPEPA
jgi:signal peptidase II